MLESSKSPVNVLLSLHVLLAVLLLCSRLIAMATDINKASTVDKGWNYSYEEDTGDGWTKMHGRS